MIALAFVVFLCLVALLRAGDRRHQADRLQVQGPDLLSLPGLLQPRLGEPDLSASDRFRNVYPDESEDEGPRELGRLAARVSGSVSPRARRRMARPARQSRRAPTAGRAGYNWFGTNQQGFDVFAQMVHGTQIALSVGFVSMGIAAAIGITVGALAGYFGGWVDMLLSRLIELVMCIPSLVLILALVAMLDNVTQLSPDGGRSASRAGPASRGSRGPSSSSSSRWSSSPPPGRWAPAGSRIMFRHVLRNALAPVLVPITFGIAAAILIESGLSYLGFGASPPNPSWGTLLKAGRSAIQQMWWLILFPGLAIFLTVLAYNLIGEGLQEATDPRLRQAAIDIRATHDEAQT